ncbi:MAG: hypothetical protein ACI9Y1_001126 [Lentisphaeria bacterium]|jgi:hypothetical protein
MDAPGGWFRTLSGALLMFMHFQQIYEDKSRGRRWNCSEAMYNRKFKRRSAS